MKGNISFEIESKRTGDGGEPGLSRQFEELDLFQLEVLRESGSLAIMSRVTQTRKSRSLAYVAARFAVKW